MCSALGWEPLGWGGEEGGSISKLHGPLGDIHGLVGDNSSGWSSSAWSHLSSGKCGFVGAGKLCERSGWESL